MGIATYGREDGWSFIDDVLSSPRRGNGRWINNKISYDAFEAGDYIARSNTGWNGAGVLGQPAEVTYSFPTWEGMYYNGAGNTGLKGFNDYQKDQARLSLQSWADVANITFKEVDAGRGEIYTNITFGYINDKYTQAYAWLPHTKDYSGDVVTDSRGFDVSGQSWYSSEPGALNVTPVTGNYGRLTFTHEIGHTLGLNHPGNYNAGQGRPSYKDADYAEDTRQYSVMSYWSEKITGADHKGYYASAPLLDDITAIQKLYGANYNIRTDDTVYGFDSNTGRDYYSAQNATDKLIFTVWDGGGNDTLNFSRYKQDQKISLREGDFSDVGGLTGNVSIAHGVVIENAFGGRGNDVIIGNDADNILMGNGGNDVLYGGAGQDQLWGGTGNDIFVFSAVTDSLYDHPDHIRDFSTGLDSIDLQGLNQNSAGEKFIYFTDEFTGAAGAAELRYNEGLNLTELLINISGDPYNYDFRVDITGQVNVHTDFIV
ncbi:serralysin family metalloprotease [Morganella morganii]|uniref:serralysin family metalloprotease n=1 Tax=Morganella morganii TaxID=582 RepID=UPI00076B44DF|nr:serralysin family metalloprotease [Morganella morganii]AMG68978.1 serine 3-dehydrogenase [Morganella morganii]EKU4285894.1 M10 family metallopeptidase [Morganella morganii]EKU4301871.1 M10 family metallopeptidase [Morganella morganii]EKU5663080.1 M10 family metallopeptidase [Morganella morganii]EKU5690424.1 M10 family metallopeptidase [Morganella morganii]